MKEVCKKCNGQKQFWNPLNRMMENCADCQGIGEIALKPWFTVDDVQIYKHSITGNFVPDCNPVVAYGQLWLYDDESGEYQAHGACGNIIVETLGFAVVNDYAIDRILGAI